MTANSLNVDRQVTRKVVDAAMIIICAEFPTSGMQLAIAPDGRVILRVDDGGNSVEVLFGFYEWRGAPKGLLMLRSGTAEALSFTSLSRCLFCASQFLLGRASEVRGMFAAVKAAAPSRDGAFIIERNYDGLAWPGEDIKWVTPS